MEMARRYPLDFDAIRKGDVLTADVLEEIFGVARSRRAYSSRQVGLAKRIERELALRGRPATVRCVGPEVRVLLDGEASSRNGRLFVQYRRRMSRRHVKMVEVDVANLTPEERDRHGRALVVQAAQLCGLRERRVEAAAAHRRSTPGLDAGGAGSLPPPP